MTSCTTPCTTSIPPTAREDGSTNCSSTTTSTTSEDRRLVSELAHLCGITSSERDTPRIKRISDMFCTASVTAEGWEGGSGLLVAINYSLLVIIILFGCRTRRAPRAGTTASTTIGFASSARTTTTPFAPSVHHPLTQATAAIRKPRSTTPTCSSCSKDSSSHLNFPPHPSQSPVPPRRPSLTLCC